MVYEHTPHHWVDARKKHGPPKTADQYRKTGNRVTRVNTWLATTVTKLVGSMWCAYIFAIFDLIALPQSIRAGLFGIVQWVASFFLQLVLLSIIMVGQNIQAAAADARSEQTYKDAEAILAEALKIQEHLAAQDALLAKLANNAPHA